MIFKRNSTIFFEIMFIFLFAKKTALNMATQNGNIEVVKTLLSHKDIDVNSLIILASIF